MHRLSTFKMTIFAAATFACAVGCNDDASERGESGALATLVDPDAPEASDAGLIDGGPSDSGTVVIDGGIDGGVVPDDGGMVPNPNGAYFVSVVPNGTGCPPGTVHTTITPDGSSFQVDFSGYEININNQTTDLTVTKNCVLSVKLHAPAGMSYAVTAFRYAGYAFLEKDVTATVSAYYRFQGAAVTPNTNRTTKVGPFDDDFVFLDDVKTTDLVWSPCGVDRELIITTQLQLRNANPKRSGYANITEMPAGGGFKLAFQSCKLPTPPKVAPGAGAVQQ